MPTDLEYKQQILDPKSASFCGAKWYNATIWLGSGMTTSCHHPLPHKIDLEEIKKNPVWIRLQSNGTDKEQLDKQFLSLTEDEKIVAIDLFESLKVVMENVLKEKKTHH